MKINKKQINPEYGFITAILALAALLRFFRLAQEGFGNLYYAATVKSMLMSFTNFFYAAFDPGGFISVDKPPVGFWLEALSAAVFGYSGWSLVLPQAASGVISVWLIYFIVKKSFGSPAGLAAAFFLAITPVFVATNRNNTIDSTLILVLLIAVWLVLQALEKKSLRYLLASVAMVGMGFNIKMLQAYLVLPAIYLTYLIFAKTDWRHKIWHLSVATVVLLVISLSWAIWVDLTPEAERPIVSNSRNNRVLDLIVGHNALDRFAGDEKPPDSRGMQPPFSAEMPPLPGQAPEEMPANRAPMLRSHLTPKMETGEAGVFRLFSKPLSGQIVWFFPIIFLGLIFRMKNFRSLSVYNQLQKSQIILWLSWLIPAILYFSFTPGLFHRYYLSMLAPPAAALAGIALIALWQEYQSATKWTRWLLPAGVLFNGLLQIAILQQFSDWNRWLLWVTIMLNVAVLAISIIKLKSDPIQPKGKVAFIVIGWTALAFLPLVWSATPMIYGGDAHLPYAGPDLNSKNRENDHFSPHSLDVNETENLVQYLQSNRQGEKFLVAVPSAILYGSKLIIQTGEPIITLGGFNGQGETISVPQLEKLTRDRKIRFFLIQKPPALDEPSDRRQPMPQGMPGKNLQALYKWIVQNGVPVPREQWQSTSPMLQQLELFEYIQ